MSRNNRLLDRLLNRNISRGQLAGYAVANLVGMAIVLTAIQFYLDVTHAWEDRDALMGSNYIVVSRQVSGLGGLLGDPASFSPGDISSIKAQPWAEAVGEFTAADFDVFASVDMGRGRMSTSLFLETIPDEFFDVRPPEWDYDPMSSDPVPIIIPKDYLALYNFGYASAHGLPQLSESMMGMLPLRLSLSGNGRQDVVDARIVGFSSRLNTIAVPRSFITHANAIYSGTSPSAPSRLIVKVTDKGDPAIGRYLSSHSLEMAGESGSAGHLNYFLSVLTSVVIAIGAVITLLSFFILMLSIYLLLQKNRVKIHDLMLLGYPPAQVAAGYGRIVICVNGVVLLLSVAVMFVAQWGWKAPLAEIGIRVSPPLFTILVAIAITLLLTALNLLSIRKRVLGSFRL